jgi:hypothetical protein
LDITACSTASVGMDLFIQWFATSFNRHRGSTRKQQRIDHLGKPIATF